MSDPAPTPAAPAAAPAAKSNLKPAPVEGEGLTLTALKMYPAYRNELTASIAALEGKPIKLVGILGTSKDDARMYAEVSLLGSLVLGAIDKLIECVGFSSRNGPARRSGSPLS